MTYRCGSCDMNWAPYQAKDGKCPECGRGTSRNLIDAPSPDAMARHKVAFERRAAEDARQQAYRDFEEFVVQRDHRELEGLLEEIRALPECEPARMLPGGQDQAAGAP